MTERVYIQLYILAAAVIPDKSPVEMPVMLVVPVGQLVVTLLHLCLYLGHVQVTPVTGEICASFEGRQPIKYLHLKSKIQLISSQIAENDSKSI